MNERPVPKSDADTLNVRMWVGGSLFGRSARDAPSSHQFVLNAQFGAKAIGDGFWENGCPNGAIAAMDEHALSTNLPNRERILALRCRPDDDAPDVDFRRLFDGIEDAARGRAEAQEELLNGELAQRVKNALSVVQAIAPITMLSAAPAHLVSTSAPTGDQTRRIELGRGLASAGDAVLRILIRYSTGSVSNRLSELTASFVAG